MRPIELRFKGLRSYREEACIDFSGLSLVAVLGDTGAGKSSVLEAICLALYNSCSWSGSAAKPLLADGCDAMQVRLRFSVDAHVWTVTRVVNRNSTPAVHELVAEDGSERYDRETEVNARIVRLIGLDHDSFLRAVILPQGQFDTLLRATGSVRTPMLEAILGINQLDEVRQQASTLRDRLTGPLGDLRLARAKLWPDPSGVARDASIAAKEAEKRASELAAAAKIVDGASKRAEQAAAQAVTLIGHAAEVAGIDGTVPAAALIELARKDAEDRLARTQLAEAAGSTRRHADELAAQLDEAAAAGVGPTHLATAAATLEGLSRDLESLADTDAGHTDRGEALDVQEAELAILAGTLEQAKASAKKAAADATAAAANAETLNKDLSTAEGLLREIRREMAGARDAASDAASAKEDLEKAVANRDRLQAAAEDAQDALGAAEEALDRARRADAAATASAGLHGGEPCPICQQDLPDGFVADIPDGLSDAERHAATARHKRDKAAKEALEAAAKVTSGTEAVAEKERRSDEARSAAEHAVAAAAAALGTFDPTREDADVLSALVAAVGEAKALASKLDAEQRRLAKEETTLGAQVTERRRALQADRRRLAKDRARTQKDRTALADRVDAFAPPLRPELPLSEASVAAALAVVAARQKEMDDLVDAARAAQQEAAKAEQDLAAHDRRHQREVLDRSAAQAVPLDRLCERMRLAAAALGVDGPAARTEEMSDPEQLASWAKQLVAVAAELAEACRAGAADASDTEADERRTVTATLAAVDVTDAAALTDERAACNAEAKAQRAKQAHAEVQIPVAAIYDARLSEAGALHAALSEVCNLLSKGKFRAWVVARRQQALLGVASDVLAKMTAGRFRFTADFKIHDAVSGAARDPRTLSGGETFLASLALALTLVEMAGRSGRRQEALFLDEGFASLDSDSLDDALEVLADQAGGGRLVAVITHLRQVAENLEHVLWVTKDVTGSHLKPLTVAERDALLSDDARSGLVA